MSANPTAPDTPATGPLAREALALGAFDHAVSKMAGFRSRPGQREMAAHIAETLAQVEWPPKPEPGEGGGRAPMPVVQDPVGGKRAIAVVQAGTKYSKN